jgi:hypothetical protein
MSNDDLERVTLLEVIMSRGVQALSRVELERLHTLLEQKDYSNDPKAQKSKKKLLKKILIAIYDKDEKYGNSFKMS